MPARTPSHPSPTREHARRRAAEFLARGEALRAAGRPRLAAECYRQAIAYDGSRADAHRGLGLALLQMDRRAEATPRIEAAARLVKSV